MTPKPLPYRSMIACVDRVLHQRCAPHVKCASGEHVVVTLQQVLHHTTLTLRHFIWQFVEQCRDNIRLGVGTVLFRSSCRQPKSLIFVRRRARSVRSTLNDLQKIGCPNTYHCGLVAASS